MCTYRTFICAFIGFKNLRVQRSKYQGLRYQEPFRFGISSVGLLYYVWMEQQASTALQEEGRMCSFCGFLVISEMGLTSSSCSAGQTLGLRQESFILARQSVFFSC